MREYSGSEDRVPDLRTYRRAIRLVWYWRTSRNPCNFSSLLFGLMEKAGDHELHALEQVFPIEVQAWRAWKAAKTDEQFWDQYVDILEDHAEDDYAEGA
ncbi:hypothetical protein [Nitrospira sp. Nam74]